MTSARLRTCSLAAAAALLSACHGPEVRQQADVVRRELEKARQAGALRCAPVDLAVAEANHAFAETELTQGNSARAQEHVVVAAAAAQRAIDGSKGCGPTNVVIAAPKPTINVELKDSDGDGILDKDDKCPSDPEDKDGFQDEDGCPDPDNDHDGVLDYTDRCPNTPGPAANQGCPVLDSDGDGIPDEIDRCPNEPEDKDGFEDEDGCPDGDNDKDGVPDRDDLCPVDAGPAPNHGCPILDRDNDGIPDEIDKCPDEPEDFDGWQDEDGCPDPDNDGDGIPDKEDACPNEPGIPETRGCPPGDRDGDGIPDHLDRCPDEPGVIEEQGCPRKYSLVVLRKEKIEIKQQVHFATNKWVILSDSFEMLNQVAAVLGDYPRLKIRIEGHTDNVAGDDFNMKLSQKRADSVREYLIKQGTSGERMVSVGYGKTMPIASNRTEKGRAVNRRVEFNITEK